MLSYDCWPKRDFWPMRKWRHTAPIIAGLLTAGLVATGCDGDSNPAANVEAPVRAIKHMELGETADANTRRLAGVVKAGTRSNVAFEISGRVIALSKAVGDTVETGDELAKLDPKPFELRVQEAEFTLRKAQATLEDAQQKHSQQKRLWEKRVTTRTAYDTAVSNLKNAEGQVGIAKSQLDLRKRDAAKAVLTAPFPGRVAEKRMDVFEEVAAGQAVYVIQTEDENEVEVVIPENLIERVRVGSKVDVTFPPLGGIQVAGKVTEISPVAGSANAFPVTIRLDSPPAVVRPGMSAEVTFRFKTDATGVAFAVPVSALKPDIEAKTATVFVYKKDEGVVRAQPVQVVGLEGNEPQIVGGVKNGDIIATAGVGDMYDGMKVRLLEPGKLF